MSHRIVLLPNRRRQDRTSAMPTSAPLTDIVESTDGFCLYCNVPGAGHEDVSVSVHKGVLHLRAEAALEPVAGKVHALEVCDVVYEAHFQLTAAIDTDSVEAGLASGVLRVFLPFARKKAPVNIPVRKG